MKRKLKQGIGIALLCTMSIGCHSKKEIQEILSSSYEETEYTSIGDNGENSSEVSSTDSFYHESESNGELNGTENPTINNHEIVGRVYSSTVYQVEGITHSNGLIHLADWEDFEFDIICTDPTCKHKVYEGQNNPNPTCSATTKEHGSYQIESILYEEKRLLFVMSSEIVGYNEYGSIAKQNYNTEVYECDLDGRNRKKLTSFPGVWQDTSGSSIICNNKIYFNNRKDLTYEVVGEYEGEYGIGYKHRQYSTYEFCSLDLETMEFTSYATQEGESSSFRNFVLTDENLYCVITDDDETTILYRLNLATNSCEEIYRDNHYFFLEGAIGSKLLLSYIPDSNQNKWDFYLYDDKAKTTKQILNDNSSGTSCVLGNQFAIMTETIDETKEDPEKDYVVAYSFFNESGKLVKTVHYKEDIKLLFTIGEHVLYYIQPNENSTKETGMYEIPINDMEQIEENGRYIFNGFYMDK